MEDLRKDLARILGFLTEEDIAVIAGVPVATVDDWRRRGNGPVHTKIGRSHYYDIADVRDFMLSCKKKISRVGMSRAL